ncbi:uncharacterized protein LOC120001744 [Tripterygium wilfordii]|uniref:uncharacterized protein LOC120001744 n=1 Tax=Tripterygium wilfordii TaxID=458696 RepID=UPI0018F84763|nr:uncharacterized protein LOC120001744 [Tripterygium wilfordii]
MGKVTSNKPLIFQSKLLCFSLLYLFTTLFLALYNSLSSTKCLFRSSPFEPIRTPLFLYPLSYGEHKYAIPTHRSSCSSPVYFSDYWMVFNEIRDMCHNSSVVSAKSLRYIQGKSGSFGGNFTTQKRFSYFDHENNENVEIPCGFLKNFPISNSDAVTLNGLDYHQLISRKSGEYKIGAWRIVRVSSKNLYQNPAMNGVIPKYLVHRLFPNSKFSIWVDAKLQLTVDPLLLIHSLLTSEEVDMAISKHPYYIHTMEEVMATARWKKWWDVNGLKMQMETYCENGLQPWTPNKPYPSDVPDSALIIRRHGLRNNLFSCLIFNELEAFNPRDQLPFAYVRDHMKPKMKMNMFEVEVFEQVAVEFRHNLKKTAGTSFSRTAPKRTKRATHDLFGNSSCCSRCRTYLLEIWGESHN